MRSYVKALVPVALGAALLFGGCAKRQYAQPEVNIAKEGYLFAKALDTVAADFNGDGLTDYAVGFPDSVQLYRGTDDGKLVRTGCICSVQGVYIGANFSFENLQLHVSDLNKDGMPDLIITDLIGTRTFLNNGSGNFAPQQR